MNQLTTAQQLLPAKQVIGRPVVLGPYQELLKVVVKPDSVTVLVRCYRYQETAREVRFTKRGLKLRGWYRTEFGTWAEDENPVIVWDEDFEPYIESRYGHHISEAEFYGHERWEAMAYRCGTPRTPLDSFNRTVWSGRDGTTEAMFQYWTGCTYDELMKREEEEDES